MSSKVNPLSIFIVCIVLIGFVFFTINSCIASLTIDGPFELKDTLIYVTNALAGVVGAIAASALGVEIPGQIKGIKKINSKIANLGSFVVTGSLKRKYEDPPQLIVVLGQIYTWSYVLVGITCIVVWLADDVPNEIVKNSATITLAIILAVVKNIMD